MRLLRSEVSEPRPDYHASAKDRVTAGNGAAAKRARECGAAGGARSRLPYAALDTCAVDGLCATACPVGIDTGRLTKRFRRLRHSAAAQNMARRVAENFGMAEHAARFGLRLGHAVQSVVGAGAMAGITHAIGTFTGKAIPQWTADMPRPVGRSRPATQRAGAQAVYCPSCISRVMGRLPGEPADLPAMEAFVRIAARAGVPVFIPEDVEGNCCGVPFSSKGFDQAHHIAANRTIARFWEWSEQGRLPVVVDTSPCTYGLLGCRVSLTAENQKKFDGLKILDGVAFAHDVLLPKLAIHRKTKSVALHPVCSVVKMNLTPRLEGIARACSDRVVVPMSAGCCGFAGDRGFLFPELTESATRREAAELQSGEHDGYFSSSRTCEIGMTR